MKSSFHHSVVAKRRVQALEKKAHTYTSKLLRYGKKNDYSLPESSLSVANDTKYQQSIKKALTRFKGIEHVVLVGIGGSSLGTEAVYAALAYKTSPTLEVIDRVNKESLMRLEEHIAGIKNSSRVAIVIVSKSGSTTETMLNAVKVMAVCEKKYGDACYAQTIFIGDKDTQFLKMGKKKKILCFTIPDIIGGRYSVFTAVGIVPLTLLGIDIVSLREGAIEAVSKKNLTKIETSAVTLSAHAEEGVHTVNFFSFNKRLEMCGMWYRQLLAESIGKNMTTKGTSFQYQLLPIVSSSVDLHSMAQLYLGGYKNMYTHFVCYDENHPYHAPAKHWLLEHVSFLRNKTFDEVNGAIREGVLKAYDDQKLPYRFTELPKCSAYEIGFLLATLMAETMYLAHILDVNAFDQPSVELYKKHMRVALGT